MSAALPTLAKKKKKKRDAEGKFVDVEIMTKKHAHDGHRQVRADGDRGGAVAADPRKSTS